MPKCTSPTRGSLPSLHPSPRARRAKPDGVSLPGSLRSAARSARGVRVFGQLRRRRLIELGFAVGVFVFAGVGFIYKMGEFTATIVNDEVEGFGVVAVATYLIGLVPVTFLMLWAVFTGRFRDLEATKRRLFELDAEIEREGNRA
jgi:hypothetical protein